MKEPQKTVRRPRIQGHRLHTTRASGTSLATQIWYSGHVHHPLTPKNGVRHSSRCIDDLTAKKLQRLAESRKRDGNLQTLQTLALLLNVEYEGN